MSWTLGWAKTSYTHHAKPLSLPTKSGSTVSIASFIQSAIPPCRLNPLLFNGHLQTMWTAIKEAGPPIYYKRKILESTHSVFAGEFTVDFVVSKEEGLKAEVDVTLPERTTFYAEKEWENVGSDDDTPMLVCLHGLSGGSHEIYLRQCVAPITAAGWEACVVNARGCAMSKITTPRLFNARATWDVRQVIEHLRQLFPNRPLYGIGFSLGANIITNYVAEEGPNCVFKAAVACSNPWNLEVCNLALKRSWFGTAVYSRAMGTNLMKLYELHKTELLKCETVDHDEIKRCKYLYEFDRAIQAPTWGYPTEGAYYRDAQSVDAIAAIRVPFLAINAEDDPISHKEGIPYEEFKKNPYAVLCCTNWGGHLSWFQFGGKRWFADAVTSFFTRMHDEIDTSGSTSEDVKLHGESPFSKFAEFDPCHRRMPTPLR